MHFIKEEPNPRALRLSHANCFIQQIVVGFLKKLPRIDLDATFGVGIARSISFIMSFM